MLFASHCFNQSSCYRAGVRSPRSGRAGHGAFRLGRNDGFGSFSSDRPAPDALGMSAGPPIAPEIVHCSDSTKSAMSRHMRCSKSTHRQGDRLGTPRTRPRRRAYGCRGALRSGGRSSLANIEDEPPSPRDLIRCRGSILQHLAAFFPSAQRHDGRRQVAFRIKLNERSASSEALSRRVRIEISFSRE